jgi:hypothetical protein
MAYQSAGLIQSSDYNTYIGSVTGVTPNTINGFFGTGSGRYGYGQPSLTQVIPTDTVTSARWVNLISNMVAASSHQGTSITTIPLTDYEIGDTIVTSLQGGTSNSIFAVDIASLFSNINNTAAQGSTTTYNSTSTSTWPTQMTALFTITFATADATRYFFNAGGQIAINLSHPAGSGINSLWNTLNLQAGTLVLSAPDSGTVRIAGTNYTGFQKVGGSGSPLVNATGIGYYALTSTWQTMYRQAASSGVTQYLQSYLSVSMKTNGTRGSNGDKGNIIYVAIKWDQVPDGGSTLLSAAGTTASLTVRPPSSTYISNTWGNPSVTYIMGSNVGY